MREDRKYRSAAEMVMIQQWQMADFKLDSRPRSTPASFHSKKLKRKEKLERVTVLLYVLQQDRRASELSRKHMMPQERCDSPLFFPTDTCWINIQKDNIPNGWSSQQMTASEDVVHWVCHQEKDYICYDDRLWTLGAFFISAWVDSVQHLPVRPSCPVRIASDKIKHQSFFPLMMAITTLHHTDAKDHI